MLVNFCGKSVDFKGKDIKNTCNKKEDTPQALPEQAANNRVPLESLKALYLTSSTSKNQEVKNSTIIEEADIPNFIVDLARQTLETPSLWKDTEVNIEQDTNNQILKGTITIQANLKDNLEVSMTKKIDNDGLMRYTDTFFKLKKPDMTEQSIELNKYDVEQVRALKLFSDIIFMLRTEEATTKRLDELKNPNIDPSWSEEKIKEQNVIRDYEIEQLKSQLEQIKVDKENFKSFLKNENSVKNYLSPPENQN